MAKSNKTAKPAKADSSTAATTAAAGATLAASGAFALPAGFTAKRVITLPVLVLKKLGDKRVIKIMDAMHVSSVKGKVGEDGKQEKPATICSVTDVENGEQFNFLVPAVVQKNLQDGYPSDGYVGCVFYIENTGKRKEGQRYNDFRIIEVTAP